MKIYKNNASVNLSLDEFLKLLEEDAVEDIIDMVNDLEQTGSVSSGEFDNLMGDLDGDVLYMGAINLDDYDGELDYLWDDIIDNPDNYQMISEEDFENLFGKDSTLGKVFNSDQEILDNFLLSNEDLKVKRIVERFRHIDDAS